MSDLKNLNPRAASLLGRSFDFKVNCFCISEFFYRPTNLRHMKADEMLEFVSQNFDQITQPQNLSLGLVWSRQTFEIPVGKINIQSLSNKSVGFPFGLVLEHSFVHMSSGMAYQKRDPTLASSVELVSMTRALAPYVNLLGYEVSFHIPKFQF